MFLRIKRGTIRHVPTRTVPSKPGALGGSAEGSPVALSLPDGLCHSEDRQDPHSQKPGAGREDGETTPENHAV